MASLKSSFIAYPLPGMSISGHDQMKNSIFHIYRSVGDYRMVDDRRIVGLVVSTVDVE